MSKQDEPQYDMGELEGTDSLTALAARLNKLQSKGDTDFGGFLKNPEFKGDSDRSDSPDYGDFNPEDHENLFLEAKAETGRLTVKVKSLEEEKEELSRVNNTLSESLIRCRFEDLRILLRLILPLCEVEYSELAQQKMESNYSELSKRLQQLDVELKENSNLQLVDNQDITNEFTRYDQLANSVVGDVMRVIEKQQRKLQKQEQQIEQFIKEKEEDAFTVGSVSRFRNDSVLSESSLAPEEQMPLQEKLESAYSEIAEKQEQIIFLRNELENNQNQVKRSRRGSVSEEEQSLEIESLKLSYKTEVESLKKKLYNQEQAHRSANRSTELSEHLTKALRLENEMEDLKQVLEDREAQMVDMLDDHNDQIRQMQGQNRAREQELLDQINALKQSSHLNAPTNHKRKGSWLDETSVDEENAKIMDLSCEVMDLKRINEKLEKELDELRHNKLSENDNLQRDVWETKNDIVETRERNEELLLNNERLTGQLENKHKQIHSLKNRLNERDKELIRTKNHLEHVQKEFEPKQENDQRILKLTEEHENVLSGETEKHRVTQKRLEEKIEMLNEKLDKARDRLKDAERRAALTTTGVSVETLEHVKQTKIVLINNLSQEINRLRNTIRGLSNYIMDNLKTKGSGSGAQTMA